jgi:hypothetical protein
MKKLLILFSLTLLLSACSPEDLFSMLAQSEVEQAASESVKIAEETVDSFEDIVSQKSKDFDMSTELVTVVDDGSYGFAFLNNFDPNSEFSHQVWAILPPVEQDGAFYEGWLVDPNSGKFISTGPMRLSDDQKTRYIEYYANVDFSSYTKVVITQELVKDLTPETHILEGEFK